MKTIQATSFTVDDVKIAPLKQKREGKATEAETSSPIVISPRLDSSHAFLSRFLNLNKEWLDEALAKHGAILFRGFEVPSPVHFEQALLSYQGNGLNNTYRGTSPRNGIDGTDYVFSAAEVPVNYPIAQHLEMSFLPAPPRNLFFHCVKASASAGGETALCDFRRVYGDVPEEIRHKLLTKKLLYTRTNRKVGARFTYDVSDMVAWPELFETDDMDQVEHICTQEGLGEVQWKGAPGRESFNCTLISEAFQHHPITGEPVWFNHSQVFHWTTFPVELFYAFLRTYEFRLIVQCLLVSIFCLVKYGLLGHKMSLNVTYGDGTPITAWEMYQIRKAVHRNMIFSRWQAGDIMAIDNFSTSHGRQPTYDGGRKVVVSWSDPMVKANTLTMDNQGALPVITVESEEEPEMATECFENPQERTLTKEEAGDLGAAAAMAIAGKHAEEPVYYENPQERTLTEEDRESLKVGLKPHMETRKTVANKAESPLISKDFWRGEH